VRLAEFIRNNHESIVAEWEAFARSLLSGQGETSALVLRDHANEILDAIADDMESLQSLEEQAQKSKGRGDDGRLGGAGKIHATVRIEGGFRLDQLVAEYRALRASVLRLWRDSGEHEVDGVTRFNEAIDEALTVATNRYMEMMDRHRDQYLGVLGHDLRNPLGAIIMGASALTAIDGLDDGTARIASRILSSARRMDRLVGDLLDLTRTHLGAGLSIAPTPMDLAPVCRQVIAELEGAHPNEPVKFTAEGDLHGEWDGDRLAQVVSNLVGNGIEHGSKRSPVTVVARDDGEDVVLEVHNEGPPIPARELSAIFEPMVSRGSEDKPSQNLGLGLYIAEQVVVAHGGTIVVTSTQAEGTTFSVHLPRAPGRDHGASERRPR
jgi:signal transduction histidine kinase